MVQRKEKVSEERNEAKEIWMAMAGIRNNNERHGRYVEVLS